MNFGSEMKTYVTCTGVSYNGNLCFVFFFNFFLAWVFAQSCQLVSAFLTKCTHLSSYPEYFVCVNCNWQPSYFVTHWCLCFLPTEWHQLSVVRRQWHGVHTLGHNWWRWRHFDRRMCVHRCQRRLAEGRLWNYVNGSPLPWSASKSVPLQWNLKISCLSINLPVVYNVWKYTPCFCNFSVLLCLTGSKPFTSSEVACPSTWVKFGQGCYDFEPVVYKLTFEESREHCKLKGRDS